ncbi:uncharacterized protein METZ01_LOCUS259443 [marine metagenome]|uniref:Uncharacterized protein n=1 Tax=marine metagenome TaxID=408172 RepID=A0A382J4Q4_9ZZZZ
MKLGKLHLYTLELLGHRNLTRESRSPLSLGIHVEHFFFAIGRTTQLLKPIVGQDYVTGRARTLSPAIRINPWY